MQLIAFLACCVQDNWKRFAWFGMKSIHSIYPVLWTEVQSL